MDLGLLVALFEVGRSLYSMGSLDYLVCKAEIAGWHGRYLVGVALCIGGCFRSPEFQNESLHSFYH